MFFFFCCRSGESNLGEIRFYFGGRGGKKGSLIMINPLKKTSWFHFAREVVFFFFAGAGSYTGQPTPPVRSDHVQIKSPPPLPSPPSPIPPVRAMSYPE